MELRPASICGKYFLPTIYREKISGGDISIKEPEESTVAVEAKTWISLCFGNFDLNLKLFIMDLKVDLWA